MCPGCNCLLVKAKENPEATGGKAAMPSLPAWLNFIGKLRDLWPAMAAILPEDMQNDLQIQQVVGRLRLEAPSVPMAIIHDSCCF